jgi:acyl-CoA thioesterase-1
MRQNTQFSRLETRIPKPIASGVATDRTAPMTKIILFAVLTLCFGTFRTNAEPLRIVAVGASNTHGWYIGTQAAYPAQLQARLAAAGVDAEVTNAGVPFDTTGMMSDRLERDVPPGTHIVILQPGANDLRFLGTRERRAANIAAMMQRLQARGIKVIVYDEEIPLRYYTLDFIHLTHDGHAMIAAALLPRVMELVAARRSRSPR